MLQQKNSTKDLKRMLVSIIEKSPSRTLTSVLRKTESAKFDGWTECVDIEHKEHLMGVVKDAISRYR